MRAPLIGSLTLALAACQGPLSTLDPGGPQAQSVFVFTGAMTAVASLAFVLVSALFALALRRGRRGRGEAATPGSGEGGTPRKDPARRWTLWLGVAFPLTVLTILLAATLWVGEGQFARDRTLPTWRATASQWQWRFAAVLPDGSLGPSTTRLVIPAGQPVIVELAATDVIHSFWVPRLAGKMDAVPGKLNRHLIEAGSPGTYLGVCAEYCGTGHDHMRFEVVATAPNNQTAGASR